MDAGGPLEAFAGWGAYWHHLLNTTEPSMCGGDAAFLSNYFDYLLIVMDGINSGSWHHCLPIGIYH